MKGSLAVGLLLFAVSFRYLQDRYHALSIIVRNHPSRLQEVSLFRSASVKFADDVRNCEDALIDEEEGFAILSCDPGRDKWNTVMGLFISPNPSGSLYIYDYALDAEGDHAASEVLRPLKMNLPPTSKDFHPLGIEYDRNSKRLYVVNHASTGLAIEIFSFPDPKSDKLTHVKSLTGELLKTANSIAQISDHELYVTNDHYFRANDSYAFSKIESYGGLPGGSVTYVNLETGEQKRVARVPFANGIAFLNDTTLAVASTSAPGVYFYSVDKKTKELQLIRNLRTLFAVDNLSVDTNGRLLIAGHPDPLSLEHVAKTNHKFHFENYVADNLKESAKNPRPRAPSWVAEWNELTGELKDIYIGKQYGCSTAAVRDVKRGVTLVVGLYERGVFVARE